MSAFFFFVNTAVPFQSLAAMELVSTDREPESLVTPCDRPCGDLCSCLEKVDNRPTCILSALFGTIWPNQLPLLADRECRAAQNGGETGGGARGSKCVQVKGRVAFASPLTRKSTSTPGFAGRLQGRAGKAATKWRWDTMLWRHMKYWVEGVKCSDKKRGIDQFVYLKFYTPPVCCGVFDFFLKFLKFLSLKQFFPTE